MPNYTLLSYLDIPPVRVDPLILRDIIRPEETEDNWFKADEYLAKSLNIIDYFLVKNNGFYLAKAYVYTYQSNAKPQKALLRLRWNIVRRFRLYINTGAMKDVKPLRSDTFKIPTYVVIYFVVIMLIIFFTSGLPDFISHYFHILLMFAWISSHTFFYSLRQSNKFDFIYRLIEILSYINIFSKNVSSRYEWQMYLIKEERKKFPSKENKEHPLFNSCSEGLTSVINLLNSRFSVEREKTLHNKYIMVLLMSLIALIAVLLKSFDTPNNLNSAEKNAHAQQSPLQTQIQPIHIPEIKEQATKLTSKIITTEKEQLDKQNN